MKGYGYTIPVQPSPIILSQWCKDAVLGKQIPKARKQSSELLGKAEHCRLLTPKRQQIHDRSQCLMVDFVTPCRSTNPAMSQLFTAAELWLALS